MQDDRINRWYEKHGKAPPDSINHGVTPDDLAQKAERLKPTSWRLEGNRLVAKTQMGELVNYISTDYIMTGTDSNGYPILTKIKT